MFDKNILKNKVIQTETGYIESDDEYYYAVGQCIKFMTKRFIGVNKGLNGFSFSNPVMNSKNIETLKFRLRALYKQTNNVIYMSDLKFNNCMAMILSYKPDNDKINEDLLQLGFLENNLLN